MVFREFCSSDTPSLIHCPRENRPLPVGFVRVNIKQNPKAFFSFARARLKIKAQIGPFLDPSTGQPNCDSNFAAETLSDQYKSVFVEPRPEWKVDDPPDFFNHESNSIPTFSDIPFTESGMEIACSELISSAAAGADGVVDRKHKHNNQIILFSL